MRSLDRLPPGRELTTRVCVVGSGAGGAVAASRLASLGVDCVLLEEGEHVPADSMTQDELEMIPRLFQERGQRTNRDQSILVMQGRALGGGTAHNTGLCVPVAETIWEGWQRRHAVPLPYAAFRPYLDRVLEAIRARVADEDEVNENNRLLEAGAAALGLSSFRAHHNRIRCSGCGYCSLGCAYNRKLSVVLAFLPEGIAHGLDVITGAEVERIEPAGGRWRVLVRGGAAVRCDAVLLAAGAVHTPLLLARSGLARGRRIGRDLRLHPFTPVGAVFDHEVVAWRGVPQTVIIDQDADFLRGGEGGYLLMVAAAQPAVSAVMTPGLGAVHREVMKDYRRVAAAGVLVHDQTRGRVRERRDGRPLIDYWPGPADRLAFRRGIRRLAELYRELGAARVLLPFAAKPILERDEDPAVIERLPFLPHAVALGSVHPQGTCPMGLDRRTSAVDGDGRLHGVEGVWVADASVFPTSLGLPPQVTTMALGWRLADHVAASAFGKG